MRTRHRTAALLTAVVTAAASTAGCSTKAQDGGGSGGTSAGGVRTGPGVSGNTITLGVLTDLTGAFAAVGKDQSQAAALYWEQQNAKGGVCGKYQVELDLKDTTYNVQTGVQLYSGMKSGVLAIQQTVGSPINTALEQQWASDKITNVPTAWARNLTTYEGNAVPGATYDVEMANGYDYMLQQGLIKEGDTVGHIYFEGEYGANGLAGSQFMAEKHNLKIVEAKIKSTDQDMSAQITQFKAAGVKAIALTVAPGQTASAATVAAAQGLDVPMLGSNPVFAPGLLQGPAAATLKKNLYFASSVPSFDKHPQLLRDYQAKFPGVTPSLHAIIGAGTGALMQAILEKACADGDLTREGLLAAKGTLTNVDTQGFIVPLDVSKVGASPSTKSFLLKPADVPGGATQVTDAFEGRDTADLR